MSNLRDLEMSQGKDMSFTLVLTDENDDPLNLAGCSVYAQVRKTYDTKTALISSANGVGISITNSANGVIVWNITESQTVGIRFDFGTDSMECVYDIELRTPSGVYELYRGSFTIRRESTKLP